MAKIKCWKSVEIDAKRLRYGMGICEKLNFRQLINGIIEGIHLRKIVENGSVER